MEGNLSSWVAREEGEKKGENQKKTTKRMILAVAVIGLENNPLFIRSFNTNADELKFHYLIHASLDLVENRSL